MCFPESFENDVHIARPTLPQRPHTAPVVTSAQRHQTVTNISGLNFEMETIVSHTSHTDTSVMSHTIG